MSDPLNQTQKVQPVIPSREEHQLQIRRLWKNCIVASCIIFVLTGGIVLALFLKGHDSKKIVEVSTAVFQVLMLSYGMGFIVPAFLTSLIKMHLGIEMSRQSASILEKIDTDFASRLIRVDALFDKFDRIVDQAEQGKSPFMLDIQAEGRKIREELAKLNGTFNRPIKPAVQKPVDGDLVHADAGKGNGSPEAHRPGSD